MENFIVPDEIFHHDGSFSMCTLFVDAPFSQISRLETQINDPLASEVSKLHDNPYSMLLNIKPTGSTALHNSCLMQDNLSKKKFQLSNRCYFSHEHRKCQPLPTALPSCLGPLKYILLLFWSFLAHAVLC